MKSRVIVAILVLAMVHVVFAGGFLTNTNQSVQFIRMLSRFASTDIDAVYFNPAGTTQFADGLYVAFHSQIISQGRTVTSTFPYLNTSEYQGDTFVPFFPDLYGLLKKDKFAVSFNFGPVAGGGTADFKKGLPSFAYDISLLPAMISGMGIPTTAYSADMAFKGSSIYYGAQINLAYQLHEMFSVSIGARYNLAKNTYQGSLGNVMINPNLPALGFDGSMIPASAFFTGMGDAATAAALADQEVDAEQTGSAVTPIIGLNFKPSEKINIGLKYELNTKMELEYATTKDLVATPMFPDGQKQRLDIPAILSGGIAFQAADPLMISVGGCYYFDKNADWEGAEDLIDNTWEIQAGLQYALTEKVFISAGFQHTQSGATDDYQADMNFELSADAIGAGARVLLTDDLALELGGLYTIYQPTDVDYSKTVAPGQSVPYNVKYDQTTWAVAFGLEYTLVK